MSSSRRSTWRTRFPTGSASQRAAEPPPQLFIGGKPLTCNVAVINFLVQLVDQRVWPCRRLGERSEGAMSLQPLGRGLFELVNASRRVAQQSGEVPLGRVAEDSASVVRVAANAVSVLVCAGVSLAGCAVAWWLCLLAARLAAAMSATGRNLRGAVLGHPSLGAVRRLYLCVCVWCDALIAAAWRRLGGREQPIGCQWRDV